MTAALAKEAYAAPTAELAACAADLVACGSLEMSADRVSDVRTVAALLPVGTKVYVNHLPRHALAGSLPTLIALREAGLEPVPHVAARRVLSRPELRSFLERAVGEAGVTKVLLIGGDDAQARGPYADAAAVLRDGVVAECGVREVGLPGYPEGHPRIAAAVLQKALEEKLTLAAEQGLGTYMVTQFSFAPARVIEYCTRMARERPTLPVYVGLAGPDRASHAAALRTALRRQRLAARTQGPGHGRRSPGHPHRSRRAARGSGPLLPRPHLMQRGGRAPVQLRWRRAGRRVDAVAARFASLATA